MKWKGISRLSKILWISTIAFMLIYTAIFIENGKVDSTDKFVILVAAAVMIFVVVVSSVNLTSDGGKNITAKTVASAIVLIIIFTLYGITVKFS
ncbi:hypothetical protein [Alkalihalobacillus sp. R86527]|uniref:hypothetical protein n=1 Tax=Alkalihalobacillus sp. R86527 TaxID=3093863 RepID=UPI003672DB71